MESYSQKTKNELVKLKFGSNEALKAELSAFMFCCGSLEISKGKTVLELVSECEDVIIRVSNMLKRLYSSAPPIIAIKKSQPKRHTSFSLSINILSPEGGLLFDSGLFCGTRDNFSFASLNTDVFFGETCFEACVRGAFLACGILCDPNKEYRMEFVISNADFADFLLDQLKENGINARSMQRNDRTVVYLKQIKAIGDILVLSGAARTMMEIENIFVTKDVKNNLNRSGNCIIGNLGKTVNAAQNQIKDIQLLYKNNVKLSPALREACELRMNNPESSLNELAQKSEISKSALNKRYIKLRQMANELE